MTLSNGVNGSPRNGRAVARADHVELVDPKLEADFLGSCILMPELILDSGLVEHDLYSEAHRKIFQALLHLVADGEPVNTVSLHSYLHTRGQLQSVGGNEYLLDLTDTIPVKDGPWRKLRVLAARRRVQSAAALVQHKMGSDEDYSRYIAQFQAAVIDLENVERGPKATGIASRWFSLAELDALNTAPPPVDFLFTRPDDETNGMGNPVGVLRTGIVALLISAGGVGKTHLLIQCAVAVATGRKWMNHFSAKRRRKVLIALGEEDRAEVVRRFHDVCHAMRLTPAEQELAAANVEVLALAGMPVALVETEGNVTTTTDVFRTLRERLEKGDWGLIILDPLSRFAGADTEKDNAAATRFIQTAESLSDVPGEPTIIIAHHTNKISRGDGSKASAGNSRGSSALTDGARWVAELEGRGDAGARLTITKSNYGRLGQPLDLVRDGAHGGYLRVATAAEIQLRVEAEGTARAHADSERLSTIAEKICAVLAVTPNQSKSELARTLQVRQVLASRAVDELIRAGRVESSTRYGYALTAEGGQLV